MFEYTDNNGTQLIDLWNDQDVFTAFCKDGKWGYSDLEGNLITDFELEEARPVYMGKAWVKIDGAWSVIAFENYDSGIDKILLSKV